MNEEVDGLTQDDAVMQELAELYGLFLERERCWTRSSALRLYRNTHHIDSLVARRASTDSTVVQYVGLSKRHY